MYLVPIHVPIYLEGARCMITTEWRRSLELLRDSFGGRFGAITVAAPTLPAEDASVEQTLVEGKGDGLELFPSFDLRCRARKYWLSERARWRGDLENLVRRAEVVHAGVDDVYRPITFEGFRIGVKMKKPTVFVQDTDTVKQMGELSAGDGAKAAVKTAIYTMLYERLCRWGVRRADLSLLKGSALMNRYGGYAKNAKEFHDTSFSAADIVTHEELERRLATLGETRALRLVYCGRLTGRKGVDLSVKIVAGAVRLGASVEFDIIGDGSERGAIKSLAEKLGIAERVRFLGSLPYDASLLKRLAGYDALLFTPTAEDTPRMIFDGYAAGLPLIGFDIGYVREREAQESATVLLPRDRVEESAAVLAEVCRNPGRLAELSRRAQAAAEYHSAENWYRRRAEWTIEAVQRKK